MDAQELDFFLGSRVRASVGFREHRKSFSDYLQVAHVLCNTTQGYSLCSEVYAEPLYQLLVFLGNLLRNSCTIQSLLEAPRISVDI